MQKVPKSQSSIEFANKVHCTRINGAKKGQTLEIFFFTDRLAFSVAVETAAFIVAFKTSLAAWLMQ